MVIGQRTSVQPTPESLQRTRRLVLGCFARGYSKVYIHWLYASVYAYPSTYGQSGRVPLWVVMGSLGIEGAGNARIRIELCSDAYWDQMANGSPEKRPLVYGLYDKTSAPWSSAADTLFARFEDTLVLRTERALSKEGHGGRWLWCPCAGFDDNDCACLFEPTYPRHC